MQALIEAYVGVYEQELEAAHWNEWQVHWNSTKSPKAFSEWVEPYVRKHIARDSPKQRLATYLQWNGILGFTETIWAIAQGEH